MTITFPLTLPTATGFKNLTVTPEGFVAVAESPWTGYQQVQRNQGQRWIFDVTLPVMGIDDAAEWESFFLSLNGREGTFLMGDPARTTPRGVGTGSMQVKGASQSGQTLEIDGATTGVTGILKKNDYVQIGTGLTTRLYRQLVDTNSDGSGNVTLTLWPRITLANSPADNAPIVLTSAAGLFRLTDDTVPFAITNALLSDYRFKAASVV